MDENEFDPGLSSQPGERPVGEEETAAQSDGRRGPNELVGWSQRVLGEVNKVFVGQQTLVRGVLASLLAEGHVLIESVPGLGKTLLGACSGTCLGLLVQSDPVHAGPDAIRRHGLADLRRIGLTTFDSVPCPVFTQFLLADEINRAASQDAFRVARDHAGESGDDRRRQPSDRSALSGHRGHPEPHRILRGPTTFPRLSSIGFCSSVWLPIRRRLKRPIFSSCTRGVSASTEE